MTNSQSAAAADGSLTGSYYTPSSDEQPPGGRLTTPPAPPSSPSRPLPPAAAAAAASAATLRELSDRLLAAQRPLRVLDALRWPDEVEHAFLAAHGRELPRVTRDTYAHRPLGFSPRARHAELAELQRDIERRLGSHPAAEPLLRRCRQYQDVTTLLASRGTPEFHAASRRLYGSSQDALPAGAPTLAQLADRLHAALDGMQLCPELAREERTYDAPAAADWLAERLRGYFTDGPPVRVFVSGEVTADAVAGGACLKVRDDASFSLRELRLLEAHEGWAHLGTTLNALAQPHCTFLTRSAPDATVTQEGIAVLTELLAFASHPARLRRLASRARAIALAEQGADFLEVYRFFLDHCAEPREAYFQAMRVFRGSLPAGAGPFTKDLAYSKGFVQVCDYLSRAVRSGQAHRVRLLFCGKTALADMPALAALEDEGLLAPPRHVPPPFTDLRALCAWLCLSGCFAPLGMGS